MTHDIVSNRILLIPLWTLISYGIGCFSAAYYVHRMRTGQDIRSLGSGNAGARNAGRVLGWPGFLTVFVLDASKGALAAWGAMLLGLGSTGAVAASVAAVAGHIWPAQLGFRGGKGLATALGSVLYLDPTVALVSALAGVVFLLLLRRPALSGVLAVLVSPIAGVLLGRTVEMIVGLLALAVLTMVAHRSDVETLWRDRVGMTTGGR